MVEFLESLRAPQCRRIVESLLEESLNLHSLVRKSKLSKGSVELHLQPLLKSKIVSRKKSGSTFIFTLNKNLFRKNVQWFIGISDQI